MKCFVRHRRSGLAEGYDSNKGHSTSEAHVVFLMTAKCEISGACTYNCDVELSRDARAVCLSTAFWFRTAIAMAFGLPTKTASFLARSLDGPGVDFVLSANGPKRLTEPAQPHKLCHHVLRYFRHVPSFDASL